MRGGAGLSPLAGGGVGAGGGEARQGCDGRKHGVTAGELRACVGTGGEGGAAVGGGATFCGAASTWVEGVGLSVLSAGFPGLGFSVFGLGFGGRV